MNSETRQLHALTGLRFFAAFAVLVHHLFGKFGLPDIKLPLGAMAVSFFFVLSGFILTYVYRDRLNRSNIGKFYFTRWARIWPLHLACLLITILVVYTWQQSIRTPGKLAINLFLLQSWVPDTKTVFSYNGVSWSISTEMFFYFVFPLFLLGGQRSFWVKYVLLWITVLATVAGLQYFANQPELAQRFDFERVAHVNPFLRLPEFCTGMGVGYIFFNRSSVSQPRAVWLDTLIELFVLALIPLYLWLFRHFTVAYQLKEAAWGGLVVATWFRFVGAVFVFALVVYVFSRSKGLLSSFFGWKPIVFLGEISFALYMIHWIVILFVKKYDWSGSSLDAWVLGWCVTLVSLCLSTLLFTLIEVPSKSALLKMRAGEWKGAFAQWPLALKQLFAKPLGWAAAIALFLSVGTLVNGYQPLQLASNSKNLIRNTPDLFRDIQFGAHLRLMGMQFTPKKNGLELHFVWQKTGELKRGRFTHLCNSEGKIVGQTKLVRDRFVEAEILEPFSEVSLIPNAKLELASTIAIGLFSKEIDPKTQKAYGCAPINRGPRGMAGKRLEIIDVEQLKELKQQISELQKAGSQKP